jgi:hypothetical protein
MQGITHLVLLLFVARENPDFPNVRLQKAVQDGVSKGAGSAGDEKRFFGKHKALQV